MKASRILAGMSAAAFAASMLSMVSASAATEIVASDFGTQIYVMGTTNWNWKSEDANFTEDGTITLTGSAADLWEASSHPEGKDADTLIGDAGVQFYLGDAVKDLADNEYTTETIEYTITASGDTEFKKEGKLELTLGKKGADGKRATTTEISLAGYESNPEDWTKLGELTVTATVKDITVVEEEEPGAQYAFPWEEENTTVAEDWKEDAYVSNEVYKLAPADKNVEVTIDYTLDGKHDYYLAALCTANGWGKVYDEKAQDKYDEAVADGDEELAKNLKENVWKASSIQGIELQSAHASSGTRMNDEDKAAWIKADGSPVLQDDGYIVFFAEHATKGSLTFEISPEAVNWFATYLGGDDGTYGGSLFQVYGVDITKITLKEAKEKPVEPAKGFNAFEMYTDNWTYQQMSQEDADARGVGFTVNADTKTYVAESVPAYYDADGKLQYGEVPEGTDAYKVTGATVWCVDIDGLADAVGAGTADLKNEDGSDLTNADKKKLAQDAGIEISNVKLLVDGKEFYSIDDSKLLYGDIEGNGKIRLEIYNEYGETGSGSGDFWDADRVEAITKEANAGTHYGVQFDITGIPEEAPPAQPVYEFAPAEGVETEYTVKTGEELELGVLLTQDGKAVKDEDVNWVFTTEEYKTNVEKTGESEGEVVVIPTDESGISTAYYTAGSESKIVTVVATLENAEDYGDVEPVVFTIYQNAPESQDPSSAPESSSSSSSSNSSNGGNSSSAPASDNNPATGAAALGTVGLLLAGAAMAVSKKKH